MLCSDEGSLHVKLLDFGIAKILKPERLEIAMHNVLAVRINKRRENRQKDFGKFFSADALPLAQEILESLSLGELCRAKCRLNVLRVENIFDYFS
jgi:hypothetical protein